MQGGVLGGASIIEASVDYLTVTAKSGEKREELDKVGWGIYHNLTAMGHEAHAFAWKGYRGYAVGQLTWAERKDSLLVRTSGALADRYASVVLACGENCTRLDLQFTARVPKGKETPALLAWQGIQAYAKQRKRKISGRYLVSLDTGETCYLGSPQSPVMFRLYNKEIESKGEARYASCFRWEMEIKGKQAQRTSAAFGGAFRPETVSGTIRDYCTRRNIPVPQCVGSGLVYRPAHLAPTDAQRRLSWLKGHIAPVIAKMAPYVDYDTLLEALGLLNAREAFLNRERYLALRELERQLAYEAIPSQKALAFGSVEDV